MAAPETENLPALPSVGLQPSRWEIAVVGVLMLSLAWATAASEPDKVKRAPPSPPIHATVAKVPDIPDEQLCKEVYGVPAHLCSGMTQEGEDKIRIPLEQAPRQTAGTNAER